MVKKVRQSDTVSGAVKAMVQAAQSKIVPPKTVKLSEDAMKFWDSIVGAKTPDEWSESDLVRAAQLARCQAEIEYEQSNLEEEGSMLASANGTPMQNPRFGIIQTLMTRQNALCRALNLYANTKVDKRDVAKSRSHFNSAKKLVAEIEKEDLLA